MGAMANGWTWNHTLDIIGPLDVFKWQVSPLCWGCHCPDNRFGWAEGLLELCEVPP